MSSGSQELETAILKTRETLRSLKKQVSDLQYLNHCEWYQCDQDQAFIYL